MSKNHVSAQVTPKPMVPWHANRLKTVKTGPGYGYDAIWTLGYCDFLNNRAHIWLGTGRKK